MEMVCKHQVKAFNHSVLCIVIWWALANCHKRKWKTFAFSYFQKCISADSSVHIYDFIFFKCKLRYFRHSDSLMFPTFEATFVAPPNHQWIWSQFLPVPPPRHLSLSQNKSTVWVHTWIDRPVFFTLVDQTTQTEPSHRRIWLIACFGFFIYMATVLLWCANLISWQPYIELKKSLSSLSALHICAFARRHCYV